MRIRFEGWHGQITGQYVIQRRNVGRALNGGVTAQSKNPAARPPNISQQKLQDRRRPNDLHSIRMLRPAHRVADCAGLLWAGSRSERFRGLQENLFGDTAVALHHLWCVTGEVALQNLEHAAGMFERRISFELARVLSLSAAVLAMPASDIGMARLLASSLLARSALIQPRLRAVLPLVSVPTGEQTVQVFCIPKIVAQDRGRVGVIYHVLAEFFAVLKDVMDESAEENDVAARAQRHPDIRHRRCAREARIHVNDLRSAFACRHHPLKSHWMIFRHG